MPTAHGRSSATARYLHAELARLDLLLHRQILRLRAAYQLSLDEFRGLYVSDQHVDELIRRGILQDEAPEPRELTTRAEAIRAENAATLDEDSPWRRLTAQCRLSTFEQDVILLALAPDVDLKYETLYAYLNNDVTRKWPTWDLAFRLFTSSADERLQARSTLGAEGRLYATGILQPVQSTPEHPSWLARAFSLAPAVGQFLLGVPASYGRLSPFSERIASQTAWEAVPVSAPLRERLRRLEDFFRQNAGDRAPVFIFEGHRGSGTDAAVEALCHCLGVPVARVNVEIARASGEHLAKIAQDLALEQRLRGSGIHFAQSEGLFEADGNPPGDTPALVAALAECRGPVVLTCAPGLQWRERLKDLRHLAVPFPDPDASTRQRLWEELVGGGGSAVPASVIDALANRFVLTPGQISDAVAAADDARRATGAHGQATSLDDFFEAARAQSDQSLGNLAVKVRTAHTWDDLVLPPTTLQQVREVAAAIRNRYIVYSAWGFERGILAGRGLKALFSGASGTGKTMTAAVIARDLGLDLYKIDLSGVVSKFIGETEKNLDRIFRAAHSSNAILFFDEADALFGKRSEVRDAHDRYANIEVAYLLQKMEDHEGVVILASNLSKNIDDAFSRRMQYVVEFPVPSAVYREQLWRRMFPAQAPLAPDVDFAFLATQFPIAGGDIRNVALSAAFSAAEDGRVITMKQLVQAMARQMVKQGKVPSATDFKQFSAWITGGE